MCWFSFPYTWSYIIYALKTTWTIINCPSKWKIGVRVSILATFCCYFVFVSVLLHAVLSIRSSHHLNCYLIELAGRGEPISCESMKDIHFFSVFFRRASICFTFFFLFGLDDIFSPSNKGCMCIVCVSFRITSSSSSLRITFMNSHSLRPPNSWANTYYIFRFST